MDMNLSKLPEIEKDRETWHATVYTESRALFSDWAMKNGLCEAEKFVPYA